MGWLGGEAHFKFKVKSKFLALISIAGLYRKLYAKEKKEAQKVLDDLHKKAEGGSLEEVQDTEQEEIKLRDEEIDLVIKAADKSEFQIYNQINDCFGTLEKAAERQHADIAPVTLKAVHDGAKILDDVLLKVRNMWANIQMHRIRMGTIKMVATEELEISRADLQERKIVRQAGALKSMARKMGRQKIKKKQLESYVPKFLRLIENESNNLFQLHRNLVLIINHIDEGTEKFFSELLALKSSGFPESMLKKDEEDLKHHVEQEQAKEKKMANYTILLYRMLKRILGESMEANQEVKQRPIKDVSAEAA